MTCGQIATNGTVTELTTKVSADTVLATISTFIPETTFGSVTTTVFPQPVATTILRNATVL